MNPATLQLILQAGFAGVLLLVLGGLGWIAVRAAPGVREFLSGLVADQRANTAALERIGAEQRAGFAALDTRLALTEQRVGVCVDRSAKDVIDVVRERTSHVVDEVTDDLRRSASDHGLTVADAPPRGVSRVQRAGGGR